MEQLWPKTRNILEFLFSLFYKYDVLLMFKTNYIMAQDKINYMQNTKEGLVSVAWENIVSAHGAAIA